MRKNVAGQFISFQMTAVADGSEVTSGTPVVRYTIDNGSQALGVGGSTNKGNGEWSYAPTQAETNGDRVAWTMKLTDAITHSINTYPVSFDPTDAVGLGVAVLADWINGGRLDLLLDAIPTTPMRGTDGANTTAPDNATIAAINNIVGDSTFGNAKLVRSATPGNALAVNAAGLVDFFVATSLTGLPTAIGSESLRFLIQAVVNKLSYDKATDTLVLSEDNSSTAKLTYAMVDDATEATRGKGV